MFKDIRTWASLDSQKGSSTVGNKVLIKNLQI